MTYYADDNGAVGEELSEVPSKAGTYHAKAELVMDDVSAYGEPCKKVTLDGETYSLPLARGWTTYTIQAKDNPENPDPENPDKPDPGDQSPVWMYTLLSLAALAVIAAVICKRRFRR